MKKRTQKARPVPLGKSCSTEGWTDLFIYSYRPLVLAAARSNHAPNLFFGNFFQGNKSGTHKKRIGEKSIGAHEIRYIADQSAEAVGVNKHWRVQVARWKIDALEWGSDFCETNDGLTGKQASGDSGKENLSKYLFATLDIMEILFRQISNKPNKQYICNAFA